jgi:hypothetical protein
MRIMRTVLVGLFLLLIAGCKQITLVSGYYSDNLNLAYNPANKLITGFYENHSGYDDSTQTFSFSCMFYLEGKLTDTAITVKTYYPADKENDLIEGRLVVKDEKQVSLKLPEEHGGCWNVQHLADEPVGFSLGEAKMFIEIRYIDVEKSWFFSENREDTKEKSYLIKGDIIYIDKIESGWLHCKYQGKNTVEGWIKAETVNKI